MSRINLSKQLELAAAARSIIVSDGAGKSFWQLHNLALVSDLDIRDWNALAGTIAPTNDFILIYSSDDDAIVYITIQELLTLAGGGAALTFESGLTKDISDVVRLGGNQTGDVTITGDNNDFILSGQSAIACLAQAITLQATSGDMLVSASGNLDAQITGDILFQCGSAQKIELQQNSTGEVWFHNLYKVPNTAPNTGSGLQSVMVWTGNGATASPSWLPYGGSGGGGSAMLWYALTVDPSVALSAMVKATSVTGMTLTKDSGETWRLTVPDGVDVEVLQFNLSDLQNPGSTMKMRFDFQGNRSDGSARQVNTNKDNVVMPDFIVANSEAVRLSGVLDGTTYIRYALTSGAGVPELRVTGVAPLELTVINYNQNNAGGNGATRVKITLPGS